MPERTEPPQSALLPLAALSAASLALEILLTKFLAYSVSALLVYVVLGIALLGFGAGGSLATLSGWSARGDAMHRMAAASFGFALTTLFGFLVFTRVTPRLTGFDALTVSTAALLVLPFLCAGLAVATALATAPNVRRAYGANLAGSAVGCLLPLALLRPIGGEPMLPLIAGLGWLAGALYLRAGSMAPGRPLQVLGLSTAPLAALSFAFARPLFAPEPEPPPLGQLSIARRYAEERRIVERELYDRWNATGRIQIFGYEGVPNEPSPYPFLFYVHDSSAGSCLAKWDGRVRFETDPSESPIAHACREAVWGQAYFEPRPRVLVIGLGGGMDVQCALYNGAHAVDVVEINPDSVAAVRGPFDDWLGRIGTNPRVHYHVGDGRSFAHRSSERYDVIQLSGVDTKNAASSGGLALSENTLYTVEAFVDYLAHLNDGGVLSIVRFSDPEAVRLSSTATEALRHLGTPHPEDNVVELETGYVRSVIVGRSALSDNAVGALAAQFAEPANEPYGVGIFFYDALGMDFRVPPRIAYSPGRRGAGPVSQYFAAVRAGQDASFVASYPFDVAPATDDRPFFFDVFRYPGLAALALPHVRVLASVLSSIQLFALGLLLLPTLRRQWPLRASLGARSSFFAAVGLAYLMIEVWLIHVFAMYLGHQTYSLGIVLFALLSSSGAGSIFGERFEPRRGVTIGVAGIVCVLALGAVALPELLERTIRTPFVARTLLVLFYTSLLGGFMGLPFSQGIAAVRARFSEIVPWCVGLNGFASVFATLAVVPISHAFGYRAVMLAGGGLYVLGAASFHIAERGVSPREPMDATPTHS